jgi:hypothetical protein
MKPKAQRPKKEEESSGGTLEYWVKKKILDSIT